MILKTILSSIIIVSLLSSCGQKSAEKPGIQAQEAIKAEVETIDSLTIELDKAANDIEQTTKELEEVVKALDNL